MKNSVLIFLYIILSTALISKKVSAQNTFQEILPLHGINSNFNDYLEMNLTNDSGCVISCNFLAGANYGGTIFKLDKSGGRVWSNSLSGTKDIHIISMQQTKDAGFIMSGTYQSVNMLVYQFLLIKTDSTGHVQWKKTIGDSLVSHSSSIKQTSDGGYVTVGDFTMGTGGNYSGLVIKTDSVGDIEWTKSIPNTTGLESVVEIENGGYLVSGFAIADGHLYSANLAVIKLNDSGDIIWQKNFTGNDYIYPLNVLLAGDSTYLVSANKQSTGTCVMINIDTSGTTIWSNSINASNSLLISSVNKTSDQGYILTGTGSQYNTTKDIVVLKTDNWGNTLWAKFVGGSVYNEHGISSLEKPDGGYLICASKYNPSPTYYDIYVISTDSLGNGNCYNINAWVNATAVTLADTLMMTTSGPGIPPSSQTPTLNSSLSPGLLPVSVCLSVGTEEMDNEPFAIYPNPSSGNFTIRLNSTMPTSIKIYSIIGELKYENNNPSKGDNHIQSENLSPGIYLIKINSGEEYYYQKVIVE